MRARAKPNKKSEEPDYNIGQWEWKYQENCPDLPLTSPGARPAFPNHPNVLRLRGLYLTVPGSPVYLRPPPPDSHHQSLRLILTQEPSRRLRSRSDADGWSALLLMYEGGTCSFGLLVSTSTTCSGSNLKLSSLHVLRLPWV